MSKHVLIVGCGQLGSRHLQAVAAMKNVTRITVMDSRQESLLTGQERLQDIRANDTHREYQWVMRLEDCWPNGDLCIVATQAPGRVDLIKSISQQLGYKHFIIEKVVAQSIEEYQDLMQWAKEQGILIWVNCKSRGYGIHQYIKSRLISNESISFTAVGGNHGLANNGIHEADLFAFYDECACINPVMMTIDPILHASKRGTDIVDLSGVMVGSSARGSRLTIEFNAQHMVPDLITITSPSARFIIDHHQQLFFESYLSQNWKWSRIEKQENWLVSSMTTQFAQDILSKGACALPTLAECYVGHEFILNGLLPTFQKLIRRDLTYCPVT